MELIDRNVKQNRISLIGSFEVFLTESLQNNLVVASHNLSRDVDDYFDCLCIITFQFGECCSWDFNVPIACGETLVLPGDFIVADDDGPIVIPTSMVGKVLEETEEHEEWEIFSKLKLENGGEISKYYPLNDEGKKEYEIWKKQNS